MDNIVQMESCRVAWRRMDESTQPLEDPRGDKPVLASQGVLSTSVSAIIGTARQTLYDTARRLTPRTVGKPPRRWRKCPRARVRAAGRIPCTIRSLAPHSLTPRGQRVHRPSLNRFLSGLVLPAWPRPNDEPPMARCARPSPALCTWRVVRSPSLPLLFIDDAPPNAPVARRLSPRAAPPPHHTRAQRMPMAGQMPCWGSPPPERSTAHAKAGRATSWTAAAARAMKWSRDCGGRAARD